MYRVIVNNERVGRDTVAESTSQGDYYSTPESYNRLWDSSWRDMFGLGDFASGRMSTVIDKRFDTYHPYACMACKRGPFTGTKLQKCSQCRVAQYCCKEHQAGDWATHKKWCKAYTSLKREEDEDYVALLKPQDMAAWRELFRRVQNMTVFFMGGAQLHTTDVQLVAMQPRCRRCLVAGCAPNVELTTCPKCHGVALCADCLGKDDTFHDKGGNGDMECENYQICMACTGMVVEHGNPLIMASQTDATKCFQPADWIEYFEKKRGNFAFPSEMLQMAPFVGFVTDGLSLPMTMLHVLGMPALLGKQGVAKLERLVVHLVGASLQEAMGIDKFIELVRLIPTLKFLHIVLITTDLEEDAVWRPLNFDDPIAIPIRSACDARVMQKKGLYHDVVGSLEAPTLVFASHPGIDDRNYTESWRPTVKALVSRDVPFVVTGYNEQEVLNDRVHLELFGGKVVAEPTANPFRGLRPYPDPTRECSDFIFSNSHFVVMQGSV